MYSYLEKYSNFVPTGFYQVNGNDTEIWDKLRRDTSVMENFAGFEKEAGDLDKVRKLLGNAPGGGISLKQFYEYLLGKEGFTGTNLSESKLKALVTKLAGKEGINKFLLNQARAYVDGPSVTKDLAKSVIENVAKQAPAFGEATGISRKFGNGRQAVTDAVQAVENSLLRPRSGRRTLPEPSFNALVSKMPHLNRGKVDKKLYSKALSAGAPKFHEGLNKAVEDIAAGGKGKDLIASAPTMRDAIYDKVPGMQDARPSWFDKLRGKFIGSKAQGVGALTAGGALGGAGLGAGIGALTGHGALHGAEVGAQVGGLGGLGGGLGSIVGGTVGKKLGLSDATGQNIGGLLGGGGGALAGYLLPTFSKSKKNSVSAADLASTIVDDSVELGGDVPSDSGSLLSKLLQPGIGTAIRGTGGAGLGYLLGKKLGDHGTLGAVLGGTAGLTPEIIKYTPKAIDAIKDLFSKKAAANALALAYMLA